MVRNIESSTKHTLKLKMIPFKHALLKFDSFHANKQKCVIYTFLHSLCCPSIRSVARKQLASCSSGFFVASPKTLKSTGVRI